MSSLRIKKILDLVQAQDQAAAQNEIELHSFELNDISAHTHVTLLSDVKNKPENQCYLDLREYIAQTQSICDNNVYHNNIMDVENDQLDPRENEPAPDFETSDMDFSDIDPTYSPLKEKKKPVPVYPGRSRSSSSSSSSSSSTSVPTSSSSSQSSIESTTTVINERHTEHANEENNTQANIFESILTESRDQENRETIGDNNTKNKTEENKKGRKRKKNEKEWKQNVAKTLRNTGKEYLTKKRTIARARSVKPPCTEKCRIKCFEKFTDEQRQTIFEGYWNMGDTNSQRSFIMSCMSNITPKYKYTNAVHPRNCNKAFIFTVQGKSVRVCKTFFMRTLDISDRVIRTVKHKIDENGMITNDLRGKHSNHSTIDKTIKNDMKQFIEAIPRIESHYTRQNSSREYIDGGKTISQLFKDFQQAQEAKNKMSGKYCTFYKVFTQEFNISFFQPRKDQCDLCLQYLNSTVDQKVAIQESYDAHLEEKVLSRQEKYKDRCNINDKNKVLVFDLQAVLQSPRGDTSKNQS